MCTRFIFCRTPVTLIIKKNHDIHLQEWYFAKKMCQLIPHPYRFDQNNCIKWSILFNRLSNIHHWFEDWFSWYKYRILTRVFTTLFDSLKQVSILKLILFRSSPTMGNDARKPDFVVGKQERCRLACASVQSGLRLFVRALVSIINTFAAGNFQYYC